MLKSLFRWRINKNVESKKPGTLYMKVFLLKILEDVVFWKKWWFSLLFLLCYSLIFTLCIYRQINLLEFAFGCYFVVLIIDAFEIWLKYKHRTSCLKRLGDQDISKIVLIGNSIYSWGQKVLKDFIFLRSNNPTKAFLLLEIIFCIIFFLGKYVNGYILIYSTCTLLLFLHKLLPYVLKFIKKIQQNAESDLELEGLLPEESDVNLDLLSFEPEHKAIPEDRQSLDFWKPHDLPLDVSDDSSDNSSSLVTNLSMEKMQSLEKDVEVTDSSEDEYIPYQAQETDLPQTSMEVYPSGTWTNAAYSMISNFGGAVANMVYKDDKKRKRISSADSSDGFEIIDKNDVL